MNFKEPAGFLFPAFLLTFPVFSSFGQALLCERGPIIVYYTPSKTDEKDNEVGWKIFFDIQNRDAVTIYYKTKVHHDD